MRLVSRESQDRLDAAWVRSERQTVNIDGVPHSVVVDYYQGRTKEFGLLNPDEPRYSIQ